MPMCPCPCPPPTPPPGASTYYIKLRVDDGLTWAKAVERRDAIRADFIAKGVPRERLAKVGQC